MGNVLEFRRTVLPEDVFEVIEGYMMGKYTSIHILAVDRNDDIVQVTAGDVPEVMSRYDSKNYKKGGKCAF